MTKCSKIATEKWNTSEDITVVDFEQICPQ